VVICLERGADLHMAQLIPLPLTVSCFSKIQIGFTFLVPAHPGSPGRRAVKRVCVCVVYMNENYEKGMTEKTHLVHCWAACYQFQRDEVLMWLLHLSESPNQNLLCMYTCIYIYIYKYIRTTALDIHFIPTKNYLTSDQSLAYVLKYNRSLWKYQ